VISDWVGGTYQKVFAKPYEIKCELVDLVSTSTITPTQYSSVQYRWTIAYVDTRTRSYDFIPCFIDYQRVYIIVITWVMCLALENRNNKPNVPH